MSEPLETLEILEEPLEEKVEDKVVDEPYSLQAKKSPYKLKPKDPNAPKKEKTEKQKEAWAKAIAKRTENREARKNVKFEEDVVFKKELDEKIVKKAIIIKKRQISKAKVVEMSESDEEVEKTYVSKPRMVKQPVPIVPNKPTYNFL
jgi:hypothetical protein